MIATIFRFRANLTLLLGILAAQTSAVAQATVYINSARDDRPRGQIDGVNVQPDDDVVMEVLISGVGYPTPYHLMGSAAEPFPLRLRGGNAGLFSKGALIIQGLPGGTVVDLTLRAWKRDSGTNYETATVRAGTTFTIKTGGEIDENGIANLPAYIVGSGKFTGLNLQTVTTTVVSRTISPASSSAPSAHASLSSTRSRPARDPESKNTPGSSTADPAAARSTPPTPARCATCRTLTILRSAGEAPVNLPFDAAKEDVEYAADLHGPWRKIYSNQSSLRVEVFENQAEFFRVVAREAAAR